MQSITHTRRFKGLSHFIVFTSLAGLSMTSWAVPDAQFQVAFKPFMQANAGDNSAIEPAANAFTQLLKTEPTNPVLMAYTGSAVAMQANTTMLPWKKMGYAEDGLSQLDKSLSMLSAAHDAPVQNGTPGVLEVKFVAASTFLAVPGFMNRNERGRKLLGDVLSHSLFASAPVGFKGSVWMKAADEATKAKNTADAKRYLDLVVQNQAPQATQAQTMLKGLTL